MNNYYALEPLYSQISALSNQRRMTGNQQLGTGIDPSIYAGYYGAYMQNKNNARGLDIQQQNADTNKYQAQQSASYQSKMVGLAESAQKWNKGMSIANTGLQALGMGIQAYKSRPQAPPQEIDFSQYQINETPEWGMGDGDFNDWQSVGYKGGESAIQPTAIDVRQGLGEPAQPSWFQTTFNDFYNLVFSD